MADNFRYAQLQPFSLAGAGAVAGATSITLKSMTDIDGNALTMSGSFGSRGFGTLEPGNGALEEQIVFTGLVTNANGTVTLSGVSSVTFEYPYTETSGLAKTHAGSVTFVISNTSGYYNTFPNKNDDETILGKYTFPNDDVSNAGIATDTDTAVATAFVTLGQLSRQAIAGAANASTTVKGLVQLATQAQTDARTTTGSTGALLVPTPDKVRSSLLSDYVADGGSANTYTATVIPAITAYTAGQRFTFKAANTNTLTSTLNVSGLGVKTIKRAGAALGAGDIISGQIYEVEYDGTDFQLISPINTTPSGSMQMFAGASAPTGWLLCDGTSYLRADYPILFGVLGSTYGSADGTHFNVPDMRGRIPVGVGTGTGGGASGTGAPAGGSALTAVALATWKGEETHTLTVPEMPSHTHNFDHYSGGGTGTSAGVPSQPESPTATSGTGGGGAHNNIQPVMGVNFIIKT